MLTRLLIVAVIMGSAAARADSLLVQTHGGVVSVVQNLPAEECAKLRARILHLPHTEEEKQAVKEADDRKKAKGEEYCRTHEHAYFGSKDNPEFVHCEGFKYLWHSYAAGPPSGDEIKSAECLK